MKKKTKWLIGVVIILLICIAVLLQFTNKYLFIYSNLMDNESKTTAQSLLSEANIPQENIDLFLTLVDEFNSVPYKGIVEQGWKRQSFHFSRIITIMVLHI